MFIEKTVFSLLYILGIFVVNYLTMYAYDYFWVSSLFHWSVFRPVLFSCSVVSQIFVAPCIAAHQASLSFTISQSLLKLMSIESVMPSSHLVLCRPLLLLPSVSPSISVFFSESALHIRWPKYWSYQYFGPSNEYLGLISFRIDWLDLFAVQRTLKSLLQCHSSKASILWCSAFFMVQLSQPCMTARKTIALTRQTFVGKVMSLLCRFVIAFLPRSKCLNFMASVTICSDFGASQNKVCHCFHSPSICHEVMGPDIMILVFWILSFMPAFSFSSFTLSRSS